MLQDLEARKPLEYEAFNGVVVRLLRQSGQGRAGQSNLLRALQYLDKKISRGGRGPK